MFVPAYGTKIARDQYIAWLDIPMQDTFFLEVHECVNQRFRDASEFLLHKNRRNTMGEKVCEASMLTEF